MKALGLVFLLFSSLAFSKNFVSMCPIPGKVGKTIVNFEYFDNRILITVTINNRGPFHMIFDTGGGNTLTPQVAKVLNLSLSDAGFGSGAGDKEIPIQKTQVASYKVGNLQMTNQHFHVINLDQIKKAFNFKNLDGVLGYEILKKCAATINYDKKKITFTDFSKFIENGTKVLFKIIGQKPVVKAAIEGIETEVLIDTGDRSSFTLFKSFSAKHNLSTKFSKKTIISGYGVGGPIFSRMGKLEKLKVGEQTNLNKVHTRLATNSDGFFAKSNLGGSVGNGILQDFIVSFNYGSNEMFLVNGKKSNGSYKFTPPKVSH